MGVVTGGVVMVIFRLIHQLITIIDYIIKHE